jgi:chaperonin cofactor prefoldin
MEPEAKERILEWLKERSEKIEERLERLREKIIGKVEHDE